MKARRIKSKFSGKTTFGRQCAKKDKMSQCFAKIRLPQKRRAKKSGVAKRGARGYNGKKSAPITKRRKNIFAKREALDMHLSTAHLIGLVATLLAITGIGVWSGGSPLPRTSPQEDRAQGQASSSAP